MLCSRGTAGYVAWNECLGVIQQDSIGKPAPRKSVSIELCYAEATRAVPTSVAVYRWVFKPQTAPSCLSPRQGEECWGEEAKRDNPHVCCWCQSVTLGRQCVLRSRGRKGRGDTSLPSKSILLYTDPGATRPQTCTCTHLTSARAESA